MPAEWMQQRAVLLAWPTPTGDFRPWYPEVEKTYVQIAREISQRQTLIIACGSVADQRAILAVLNGPSLERIRFVHVGYDDIWVRDTAPLTVETPQGALLLDFRFNSWGRKYDCSRDETLAKSLLDSGLFGKASFAPIDFVLEGGSIETDGEGTLLTTRTCLLNPNRNPSFSQEAIEQLLRETLGIRRFLWLGHGDVEGDDTDAHVDTLARFCDADTIAYTSCDDPDDHHYVGLKAMETELRRFRTKSGTCYRLVPLPIPKPIFGEERARLPATYANFLIINDAVLLPVYGDARDEVAQQRLAQCFPTRQVVPIDCRSLIRQYGGIHCMTMQFPNSLPIPPP
jgi:agmatine/peptidylarginine deiminase